jgi:predicted ATP-dependent endonuclease of OLD family
MHITFVEICNFRKLRSVRVDFTKKTTLFVGANNSGKTSAMLALRYFLVDGNHFNIHDLTLSRWKMINKIGLDWKAMAERNDGSIPTIAQWIELLPSLDVWLDVAEAEIHHVSKLYPVVDWTGGLLGVRLQWRPKEIIELYKDYTAAIENVATIQAAAEARAAQNGNNAVVPKPKLWPQNLIDFLQRRMTHYFDIQAYNLDPAKCLDPENGIARPQALSDDALQIDGDPFRGLIRIDEINAQRGLGGETQRSDDDAQDRQSSIRRDSRKLSEQLRAYYVSHLDPLEQPDASDLAALQAIEVAQTAFDNRLEVSFDPAFKEVAGLNYPGVTDPRLKVSTRIRPIDGLDHDAAVQYEIDVVQGTEPEPVLRLPEDYNGLGYQNLISMVFRLMRFRDAWMRVGKAGKRQTTKAEESMLEPLHLVLIEEPEAHLHAQVQQVFIRRAYGILRNHSDLRDNTDLTTQLVVSTHSSHVAHETSFECLRYFRRLPASKDGEVPISTVVNLTEVFGDPDDTARFVMRYLQAAHCDLFFADAAILIEGSAERMLGPHFVRTHFEFLNQCYITWLEIGGSHAHRFEPLVRKLGLTTLVITDIDTTDASGSAVPTARGQGYRTNSNVLKTWCPKKDLIDDLLDLTEPEKVITYDLLASVRVAYQTPLQVSLKSGAPTEEALPYTFEDALVLENLGIFASLAGTGLVRKFKDAINGSSTVDAVAKQMFSDLRGASKKAEFALDVLALKDPASLNTPTYIAQGLGWLQDQLRRKLVEVLPDNPAGSGANP